MSTARLIQLAWMLPALVTMGIGARHMILDVLERREHHGRSWS